MASAAEESANRVQPIEPLEASDWLHRLADRIDGGEVMWGIPESLEELMESLRSLADRIEATRLAIEEARHP